MSDGNVYVLSIPSFRWIRVTEDNDQRQRHQCHLLGGHTMLVVGGIQPGHNNMQPGDVSGCDSSSKFSQGLGIFSLNDHSWRTKYDPIGGIAAYQVHPSISQVIGGDKNGSATLTMPDGGFSDQALGSLVGVSERSATPSNSTSSTTPKADASPTSAGGKKLSGGVVAGIAVGAIALMVIIGAQAFMMLRRRQQQIPNTVSIESVTSSSAKRLGELDRTSPASNILEKPADVAKKENYHELSTPPKPLPEVPGHYWHSEPQEMEAGTGVFR